MTQHSNSIQMTQHSNSNSNSNDKDKSSSQRQQQEIDISSVPSDAHSKPCPDLLNGSRKDYIKTGIPLYEASINGDWEIAEEILVNKRELVRYSITENCETALHVAASAKGTKEVEEFVENLMTYMEEEDLELKNNNSNTALCLAAEAGNGKIVKMMVKRHRGLMAIPGSQGMTPLYMAALFGKYDVVKYLYMESQKSCHDCWTLQDPGWLLLKCVENDMFDIALKIVRDHLELGSSGSVLRVLAPKTDAFAETKLNILMRTVNWVCTVFCLKIGAEKESEASQLLRLIWENIAEKPVNEIDIILRGPPDLYKQDEKPAFDKEDQTVEIRNINKEPAATTSEDLNAPLQKNEDIKYSSRIPFVAAEMGNTRFLVKLILQYPELMWKLNDNNQSIFHTAVENRHESIYNILYEIGSKKNYILHLKDKNDNNMLHLVGKCANKKQLEDVPGVVFQMQRALLWFKEVQKMVPLSFREQRNKDGLTPHELFTKDYKDLARKTEDYLRGMSTNCMVVAGLIIPVAIGAAFTVPGGYNQNNGIPIFSRKVSFMVFLVADAISFFSALCSLSTFLSIFTSGYAERDFSELLPKKLVLGLATLLLALTTMMVAFSSSFFILYHEDLKWMPLLLSLLATMPVLVFATLHYPLAKDMIRSTYVSRYLFRPKKPVLYENHLRYPFALRFFPRCYSKILKLL